MTQHYYKRLAESMTRKVLEEAWSDSMPNWMKPRLNATAYYSDRNSGNKAAAISRRTGINLKQVQNDMGGGSPYDQADYQKPRGGSRGKSLYDSFKEANIDLNQVKFIEGEPPTSKNDFRIQPPNIGIWNLPGTGQVYAMGINDLEKLRSVPGAEGNYAKYADYVFKYLPIKALNDLCNGQFCYIEGSNIPKRDIKALQRDRVDYTSWENNNPELTRGLPGDTAYSQKNWYWSNRDKSGYLVVPSAQRLAKQLARMKAKNWSTWFTDAENKLQELYADISSVMNAQSWKNADIIVDNVNNALSFYRYALSDYKMALKKVQDLIDSYGENTPDFLERISRNEYGSVRKRLDEVSQEINNARNYIDKFVLKYIDF